MRVTNDRAADLTTAIETALSTSTSVGGHGLANLEARVGALGGTATASRQADTFQLEVSVPISEAW